MESKCALADAQRAEALAHGQAEPALAPHRGARHRPISALRLDQDDDREPGEEGEVSQVLHPPRQGPGGLRQGGGRRARGGPQAARRSRVIARLMRARLNPTAPHGRRGRDVAFRCLACHARSSATAAAGSLGVQGSRLKSGSSIKMEDCFGIAWSRTSGECEGNSHVRAS
jgi:hypothetical protein